MKHTLRNSLVVLLSISCVTHASDLKVKAGLIRNMNDDQLVGYIQKTMGNKLRLVPEDVSAFKERVARLPNKEQLLDVLLAPQERAAAQSKRAEDARKAQELNKKARDKELADAAAAKARELVQRERAQKESAAREPVEGGGGSADEGSGGAGRGSGDGRGGDGRAGSPSAADARAAQAQQVSQEIKRGSQEPEVVPQPVVPAQQEIQSEEEREKKRELERQALEQQKQLAFKKALAELEEAIKKEDAQTLSGSEQKASDELFLKALAASILRGIPAPRLKIQGTYSFDFNAYKKNTRDMLAALGNNPAFKKPARLKQLVGFDQQQGLFEQFIAINLTKKDGQSDSDFMYQIQNKLHDEAAPLEAALKNLIQPCLFVKEPGNFFGFNPLLLCVNCVVAQCTYPAAPADASLSDGTAQVIIKKLLAQAAQEKAIVEAKKKYDEYNARKKATDDRVKSGELKREAAEPISEPTLDDIVLSKDYVALLHQQLIVLCLDPEFLRPYRLLGYEFVEQAEKATLPLAKANLMPMLLSLPYQQPPMIGLMQSTQQNNYDAKNVKTVLKAQLVFDGDWFDTFLLDPNAALLTKASMITDDMDAYFVLRLICKNHTRLLRAITGEKLEKSIADLVGDRLRTAKTVKDIVTTFETVLKAGGKEVEAKRELIQTLLKNLKSDAIDAKRVDAAITELMGQELPGFITKIERLINEEAERKRRMEGVVAIMQNIKANNLGGKTVDRYIVDAFSALYPNGVLPQDIKRMLSGPERLPKDVGNAFARFVPADRVAKEINLYASVEPYGLIVKILKDLAQEAAKTNNDPKKMQEVATQLVNSLEALQKGVLESNKKYFEGVQQNETAVKSSKYKGTLAQLIAALEAYDAATVLKVMTDLIERTGIPVEYASVMSAARKPLTDALYALLYEQLEQLNKGAGVIEMLPTAKGAAAEEVLNRNKRVYIAVQNTVTPLLELLRKQYTQGGLANLSEKELAEMVEFVTKNMFNAVQSYRPLMSKIDEADKKTVLETIASSLDAYLRKQQQTLNALATFAKTYDAQREEKAAGAAAEIPLAPAIDGIPDAPPMEEGGIPQAPPL